MKRRLWFFRRIPSTDGRGFEPAPVNHEKLWLLGTPAKVFASSHRRVRIYPHQPSIGMPGDREQELKKRLASVLWDAVEECVQRLDAESVNEKVRR